MTRHEPECYCHNLDDHLDSLPESERPRCSCTALRAAYRRGYNDHARSQALGAEMYGTPYQQHGPGENP